MRQRKTNDKLILQMLESGKQQKEIAEFFGVSEAAISKRLKRITPPPDSLQKLTAKEQDFVIAVAQGKSRTAAVMQAYDVTSRESAKALQRTLMKKPEIVTAIEDLMETKGIGREYRIDKLKEHLENPDPVVSLKSLDMAFKIADDAGERKKEDTYNPCADIDIVFLRKPASIIKLSHKCSICERESDYDFCKKCTEKYPNLIDKVKRHWAGDRCAVCDDDRRCYDFCKACIVSIRVIKES